jgi:hypothetical protein
VTSGQVLQNNQIKTKTKKTEQRKKHKTNPPLLDFHKTILRERFNVINQVNAWTLTCRLITYAWQMITDAWLMMTPYMAIDHLQVREEERIRVRDGDTQLFFFFFFFFFSSAPSRRKEGICSFNSPLHKSHSK